MGESKHPKSVGDRARACLRRFNLFGRIRSLRDRAASIITTGQGEGLRFSPGRSNERYGVGDNELPVQYMLAKHLKPGSVFLDIGANVGFLTVIGARLVGAHGLVYAFEPVRENVALILRNVRQNGFTNVVIIDQAVSSKSGSDRLVLAAYSGGAALVVADRPPDAVREVTVATVSIDDAILAGTVKPPTFVKIDVEGAEIQVLQGMSLTLEEHHPTVLYEIDGPDATTVESKAQVCRRFLEARGYCISKLEESYPGVRWHVEHYLAAFNAG